MEVNIVNSIKEYQENKVLLNELLTSLALPPEVIEKVNNIIVKHFKSKARCILNSFIEETGLDSDIDIVSKTFKQQLESVNKELKIEMHPVTALRIVLFISDPIDLSLIEIVNRLPNYENNSLSAALNTLLSNKELIKKETNSGFTYNIKPDSIAIFERHFKKFCPNCSKEELIKSGRLNHLIPPKHTKSKKSNNPKKKPYITVELLEKFFTNHSELEYSIRHISKHFDNANESSLSVTLRKLLNNNFISRRREGKALFYKLKK